MSRFPGSDDPATSPEAPPTVGDIGRAILPALALAQFLATYANTSLNVSISAITLDLDTTVTAVQTSITLFTLVMAMLMIAGSKLTDIWGRKRTFLWGIAVFAAGSAIAALATGMGFVFLGHSLLQGIGSALLIPPIYILVTVSIDDLRARAAAFGVVAGAGGLGSAAGPLIGGLVTTALSWRATFASQILLAVVVILLSRRFRDVAVIGPKPSLDVLGTVLSALGMGLIVVGLLLAADYGWLHARQDLVIGSVVLVSKGAISPVWLFVGVGLLFLLAFYLHIRAKEQHGGEPLVHTRVLANRAVNLGLVTQAANWFMLIGTSFVVSVFLQVSLEQSALRTGIYLMPATIGILLASWQVGRLARRFTPRTLLVAGFLVAIVGTVLMLLMGNAQGSGWLLAPGLFLSGLGLGIVEPTSVNGVQSLMPERDQGEISGVSRSVSNLGSSLGTAVAGGILISALIVGVASLTEASTVLPPASKEQIGMAMEGDVSTLSDTQVRAALQGQPPAIVDEVVRINAEARDRALGLALASIGLAGLIGLGASLLLPAAVLPSAPESLIPPSVAQR
jgi:MFS family permease